MKSGSLNLLETFGLRWACYGTALPFTFLISKKATLICHSTAACPTGKSNLFSMLELVLFVLLLHVRTEALATVSVTITGLGNVTPCSLVDRYRRFGKYRQIIL